MGNGQGNCRFGMHSGLWTFNWTGYPKHLPVRNTVKVIYGQPVPWMSETSLLPYSNSFLESRGTRPGSRGARIEIASVSTPPGRIVAPPASKATM